jgi:hypothetical protein
MAQMIEAVKFFCFLVSFQRNQNLMELGMQSPKAIKVIAIVTTLFKAPIISKLIGLLFEMGEHIERRYFAENIFCELQKSCN